MLRISCARPCRFWHSFWILFFVFLSGTLFLPHAGWGTAYYVAATGNDTAPGTLGSPWRTISASLTKLAAGDTLYVRGGHYYEAPIASASGTESAPIVVRSYPGELGTIDSGFPEFQAPGNAEWELVDATTGEYRTVRSFPKGLLYGYVGGVAGYENERVALIPYESSASFRSTTDDFNTTAFYVGPGTYRETNGRIHVRLAKTADLRAAEAHYGTVFPAERPHPADYPLYLSNASHTLRVNGAHWVFKELTFHHAKRTIYLAGGAHHVRFENVTVWAGNRAISAAGADVHHVTITRSRIYGDSPYWVFWSDMNDAPAPANAFRSTSIDLRYGAHDWEISFSHIRGSSQDLIGLSENESNVEIHHNRIENCGDDAFEIEGSIDVGRVAIYENYIANCLVAVAPGQSTASFTGPLLVYRNVIALLRNPPVNRKEGINAWNGGFRFGYEYMFKHGMGSGDDSRNAHYYHNTLVMLGTHAHGLNITPKNPAGVRIANNLMVMVNGVVNKTYRTGPDLVVDGNLYWKMNTVDAEPLLASYDDVAAFTAATGFEAHGMGSVPKRGTDPGFAMFQPQFGNMSGAKWELLPGSERWGPGDFVLGDASPARGAGVVIPAHATLGTLPDSRSSRDIGAIPYGTPASTFDYFPFDPNGPASPPEEPPPPPPPPGNAAPNVEAGADLEITLPAGAHLAGIASDDGLPNPPGALTVSWSMISGPASVSFGDASAATTTAHFGTPGTYVLQLSASDGELSSSDALVVTVHPQPPPPPPGIEVRVAQSSDDAEEAKRGRMALSGSDLRLVTSGKDDQLVGLRFAGLSVARGAVVKRAYVQFTTRDATTGPVSLGIRGEASNHAATFAKTNYDLSSRPLTAAGVSWAPAAWTSAGAAEEAQRTPDLSAIVQEIVNRPGWSSGNAIVLVISGSGTRSAVAYDGNPSQAPLLHVEIEGGAAAARSASLGDDGEGLTFAARVIPNPLSGDGVLRFSIATPGPVRAEVYDVHGRLVSRLVDAARLEAGTHQVPLAVRGPSGRRLDSGVYFYRLRSSDGAIRGRFFVAP